MLIMRKIVMADDQTLEQRLGIPRGEFDGFMRSKGMTQTGEQRSGYGNGGHCRYEGDGFQFYVDFDPRGFVDVYEASCIVHYPAEGQRTLDYRVGEEIGMRRGVRFLGTYFKRDFRVSPDGLSSKPDLEEMQRVLLALNEAAAIYNTYCRAKVVACVTAAEDLWRKGGAL